MLDKKISEQTAFETGGIPTPSDQENIGSTDKISEAVEGMMDNIEHAIYPEEDKDDR
ncbi:hypothetical protein [Paenibacillus hemerocallicola]|uniref:hypothetical protein n=1 Tax=Paenibacillus hemerocallicola TaxID=1172614 RepID=UPI00159EC958|nr:hypothetical protein [Paenibacillus hemerocallicola]